MQTVPGNALEPRAAVEPDQTMPDLQAPLLRARDIRKAFPVGERSLEILHGADLELHRGELVALVGASGAGKSTLLHILGLLDRPSGGTLEVLGTEADGLSIGARAALRNKKIGFVFQFYHLIPELTALENTLLPAMIGHSRRGYLRDRRALAARATKLLTRFGMAERLEHRPPQLSGGERQRVAMARALFQDPEILLADEPTGNLDRATGERVLELLLAEQRRRSLSMILVTHDEGIASRCGRILKMEDGRVVSP